MAAPARGVLALAIAARGRPVENGFNATAYAAGCFRFLRPDRLKNLQHQSRVDCLDRKRSDNGIGIGRQRRAPLRGVLAIAPAGPVGGNLLFCAVAKRHRLSGVKRCLNALGPTGVDRVNALMLEPALLGGPLARLG